VHPVLGRFLSRDAGGFIDGDNLYRAYFTQNFRDSSGALVVLCGTVKIPSACCTFDADYITGSTLLVDGGVMLPQWWGSREAK